VALRVRTLSSAEHLAFVRSCPAVSFLQTPAWGEVKREWRAESIGWFDSDTTTGDHPLVGAALVLYRRLPRMRRSLAYLPEGPVINWTDPDLASWLAPLTEHVTAQGAFGIRMGPPVVSRRWSAATVKSALAGGESKRLGDVPADATDKTGAEVAEQLTALGWRPPVELGGGFAAGQPKYVFQIPLEDRTEDEVFAGMNQLWRRNIRKAAKAGVETTVGSVDDLPEFHTLYVETARRDHFTPRPLTYFQTMFRALTAEEPDRIRLYLARHDGELAAATIGVRVGAHAWYSYGASSTHKRDVRGSNALQWFMIKDAMAAGAQVYDLRGITDTLDESDPHVGLLQFKVGTGGEAIEYLGEWDLPISRILYTAFDFYMRRRGG
jgi:lipid II:glycine glycyltransferase (peptidoglycan interpeptide bridge formation enzyme)